VGGRGVHTGITARGQRYTSIGLPGTGISWREYHTPHHPTGHPAARCDLCAPGHAHIPVFLIVVLAVIAATLVVSWVGGK